MMAVACGSDREARPGVIVSYGDTRVTITSLEEDPLSREPTREATRGDLLQVQTQMMCQHPEGLTALQERSFISTTLQEKGVDPDSFDLLTAQVLATPEFMDELAVEMNLQCPAQLARLLGQ